MILRRHATVIDWSISDPALVERANGPGTAPTAFRIWTAGENKADDGAVIFSKESATLLLAEQTSRDRLYSIDFDHLSLQTDRPATSGRAAGWHSLAVREGDLWAVNVSWCADAKAGLEAEVPEWRFFSPAFKTTKDGEIVSYINLALCINPMTHGLPTLAAHTETKGENKMDPKKCAALLAAINSMQDGAEKDAVLAAHKDAFLPGGNVDEKKAADGSDDDDKKKPVDGIAAEGGDDAKDSDEQKPMKTEEEKETEKKSAAILAAASLTDPVAKALADENIRMHAKIDQIEKDALLAKYKLPEAARKYCQTLSVEGLTTYLASHSDLIKNATIRKAAVTQGATQGGALVLEGSEKDELDRGMGMHRHSVKMPERKEDGTFVLHTVRPSDLRTHLARKAG